MVISTIAGARLNVASSNMAWIEEPKPLRGNAESPLEKTLLNEEKSNDCVSADAAEGSDVSTATGPPSPAIEKKPE